MIFVLSGPSASGKTTLMNEVLRRAPIQKMITVTTRLPRKGEKDGVDYRFLTVEEFEKEEQLGNMIEKTEYAGVKYGILRQDLEPFHDPRRHGIVILDAVGHRKMCEFFGKENVRLVFIYAELFTLFQRMVERGEKMDVIRKRIVQAKEKEFVLKNRADLVIHTEEGLEESIRKLSSFILTNLMASPR